jgi:hypothetical protein
MITPISFFIAVTGVAECVAQSLEDNTSNGTLGRPDRVLIAPGQEVPWDIGGGKGRNCSQLGFVFQHGPYASSRFPVEELEDPNAGCVMGPSAVRVIGSLVRCEYHPSPSNDGRTPPSPEQQTQAALWQSIEGFYMREAVMCCLSQMKRTYAIDDYRVSSIDRQVNGDAGEVSIVFSIQII